MGKSRKLSLKQFESVVRGLVKQRLDEIRTVAESDNGNTSIGQKQGFGAYGPGGPRGTGVQISGQPMMEDDEEDDETDAIAEDSIADQAIGQDDELVTNLFDYVSQSSELYKMAEPIRKNLMTRMLKQTYNPDLAVKLWLNLVDLAAKTYQQEIGPDGPIFTKAVRVQAASRLAKDFQDKVNNGSMRVRDVLGNDQAT